MGKNQKEQKRSSKIIDIVSYSFKCKGVNGWHMYLQYISGHKIHLNWLVIMYPPKNMWLATMLFCIKPCVSLTWRLSCKGYTVHNVESQDFTTNIACLSSLDIVHRALACQVDVLTTTLHGYYIFYWDKSNTAVNIKYEYILFIKILVVMR